MKSVFKQSFYIVAIKKKHNKKVGVGKTLQELLAYKVSEQLLIHF